MDNRRQVEALRAANRGMARAVCQGAKTAKRYAALGAGMEVDAQGYGREPTAMVRGVLSCLFVCLFVPNPTLTHLRSVPRRDLLQHLPLPVVSASSLFSQQWVVVRLSGQHHELMHQLAGHAESPVWEG